jgi:hypothetical protein
VELQQQISAVESRLQEENLLDGTRRALVAQLDAFFALAEKRNTFCFRMMLSPRTIEENFSPATDYRLELMQA